MQFYRKNLTICNSVKRLKTKQVTEMATRLLSLIHTDRLHKKVLIGSCNTQPVNAWPDYIGQPDLLDTLNVRNQYRI
mgnify:CR=1 FL=1